MGLKKKSNTMSEGLTRGGMCHVPLGGVLNCWSSLSEGKRVEPSRKKQENREKKNVRGGSSKERNRGRGDRSRCSGGHYARREKKNPEQVTEAKVPTTKVQRGPSARNQSGHQKHLTRRVRTRVRSKEERPVKYS